MAVVDRYSVSTRGIAIPDYAQPMPLGQVQTTPESPVYTSTDVNELAVRLGSPDSFDRRGNIIFMDDFEGGINKWCLGGAGTLGWVSTPSRRGGYSMEINTPTGARVWAWRGLPYPILSRLGFEINVNMPRGHIWTSFRLWMNIYSATELYAFAIEQNGAMGLWNYIRTDAAGVWEEWVPLPFAAPDMLVDSETIFNSIKMVMDMKDTMQYERLIINGTEYSLRGLEPYHRLAAWTPIWELFIELQDTVPTWGFLDTVIITQNEPANIPL